MVPLVGLELEGQGHLCELWSHAAHHHPVACTHPSWLWSCVVMITIEMIILLIIILTTTTTILTTTIITTTIVVIINDNHNNNKSLASS